MLIIGIGYVFVVYPVYFLFTLHYPIAKQVSDTTEILTSFATGPTPAGQLCHGMRCLADLDIWMAKYPVTRPYGEYLLGLLMSLQRSDGGNVIYFLGRVVDSGGWIYFPVLFLLKEPLPTLIIIFIALVLATWLMIRAAIRKSPHRPQQSFGRARLYRYPTSLNFRSHHLSPSIGAIACARPSTSASGTSFRPCRLFSFSQRAFGNNGSPS